MEDSERPLEWKVYHYISSVGRQHLGTKGLMGDVPENVIG